MNETTLAMLGVGLVLVIHYFRFGSVMLRLWPKDSGSPENMKDSLPVSYNSQVGKLTFGWLLHEGDL